MQFKCQNPDHPFITSALYSPELTHEDKVLAKKILGKYPQFKSHEVDDFDLYVLGKVTDKSDSSDIEEGDRRDIERKVLGNFYKFYRRCLSGEFKEKLCIDSFLIYIFERQVKLVEKIDIHLFYNGIQSLIEDKSHLLA